jgi:hypothetical protein
MDSAKADGNDEMSCPACEECGSFTLAMSGSKVLARCLNCGDAMEIAIVRCCDLHGRNCEPGEQCCQYCTEERHLGWTDERGVQRFGHPAGEICSAPPAPLPACLAVSGCGRASHPWPSSRRAAPAVARETSS